MRKVMKVEQVYDNGGTKSQQLYFSVSRCRNCVVYSVHTGSIHIVNGESTLFSENKLADTGGRHARELSLAAQVACTHMARVHAFAVFHRSWWYGAWWVCVNCQPGWR